MSKEAAVKLYLEGGLRKDAIATELGVSRNQAREWLKGLKKRYGDSPLSETAIPKIHNATVEEVLDDLRSMAEADPERVMTRNFYRINGKYSESAYTKFFGTFHEFKRQAGIVLTRQQHNIEKQIAKHASVDHYREMNAIRFSYGDKYLKPNNNRFKRAVIIGDLHDTSVDHFYMEVLIDTLTRTQPDAIIINGDCFDLAHFSRYDRDIRDWDVVGRIKFVHNNILKPIREACPDAEIFFHEGNHEARILKHLADATPALRVLLSDLHGMSVSTLLGLDAFGINYVAKADLSAYTLADMHKEVAKNYKVYWDCFIVSHDDSGSKLGFPGVNGHHHKTIVTPMYNEHFGAFSWVQHGCGHKLDAEYCHPRWQLGFVIANCDTQTKRTEFDVVTFSENFVTVGGKFYER